MTTFTIQIRGLDFTFDLENLKELSKINEFKSTALIKWRLDKNNRPYITDNNQKVIYLVNRIMKKKCHHQIKFRDNNIFNYSKNNLFLEEEENKIINYNNKNYYIIKKYDGHVPKMGVAAGQEKNAIFKCIDYDSSKILYLMNCGKEIYTLISCESIEKIKYFNDIKVTWYRLSNGYIGGHVFMEDKKTIIYLHQHLMDHYGNGLGPNCMTVDHINRDKTDNRLENLRIISQSEQNKNTGKRNRKHNAKPLPEGITQDMMPKYVNYYHECYDKKNNKYREFFKIEHHPKINKPITSSKSNKVSIEDKLEEIKGYLKLVDGNENVNKNVKNSPEGLVLPVGMRYKSGEKSDTLILDTKQNGFRYNVRMKVDKNKSLEENFDDFKLQINKKYSDFDINSLKY